MKRVFDADYKEAFLKAGLLESSNGELQHLISDAATMQIIRWTDGGFGMAAHNYDGDMLTDEVAQVHRSPGFITSNLIGKAEDGTLIKEFEASHGTVADMWEAHLREEETSLNPLGMVEALIGAMQHACKVSQGKDNERIVEFTNNIRTCIHRLMATGMGTRDLCGPEGLTTEAFIDAVAERLNGMPFPAVKEQSVKPKVDVTTEADMEAIQKMFAVLDVDKNGVIDIQEFTKGLIKLNLHPKRQIKELKKLEEVLNEKYTKV